MLGTHVLPWNIRTYYLPQAMFVSGAVHDGELPLWNPLIYCGHPFVANIQVGLFYPPRLIATLLGGVTATRMLYSLELELLLHVLLAGTFCFLLLEELGIARGSALFGATSFQLGCFFTSQVEHLGAIEAAAWLPFIWLFDPAEFAPNHASKFAASRGLGGHNDSLRVRADDGRNSPGQHDLCHDSHHQPER